MKNLSDITLVVDRSGSMASIEDEAQGGINTFIRGQMKIPGEAIFTLVHFDNEVDTVFDAVPLNTVPPYYLEPRGTTRLFDAVCFTIIKNRERIKNMKKKERPDKVIMMIVTDGHENASKEFRNINQVKELITEQRKKGWQFLFLSADEKGFNQAQHMGMNVNSVAKISRSKMRKAYGASGQTVSDYRTGEISETVFDDDQKEDMS